MMIDEIAEGRPAIMRVMLLSGSVIILIFSFQPTHYIAFAREKQIKYENSQLRYLS